MQLHPAAPFRLDLTAWAIRRRPRDPIDVWDGVYRCALVFEHLPFIVEVTQPGPPQAPVLTLTVTGDRGHLSADRVDDARRVVASMLGIDINLAAFYLVAGRHPRSGMWQPHTRV